jgi:hypothetical protein
VLDDAAVSVYLSVAPPDGFTKMTRVLDGAIGQKRGVYCGNV